MKYRVYWLSGEVELVEGNDIADALNKAGYGAGAVRAIDWYEPDNGPRIVQENR